MHMPSPTSRPLEYRLNQVLDYIDGHLGQNLNLDCLAALAHLSRYHFLRRFQQWSAEAPHAYVRRRRLETGASQLLAAAMSRRSSRQRDGDRPKYWRNARAKPSAV